MANRPYVGSRLTEPAATTSFKPPTLEQVEAHLAEHAIRLPSPWAVWAPLLALGGLLAVVMVVGGVAAMLLPWLALVGLFCYMLWRVRRARTLEQRVTQAQEMAMLRRYGPALKHAWRLVPMAVAAPGLYLRALTLMAHCLEQVKAYEQAIACFDALLEALPREHAGATHLRVHRAMAALGAERLLDADDELRSVRGVLAEQNQPAVTALYRLAELLQLVRTGHYDDALPGADDLLDELRPLGVEAGYGHALLALCYRESRSDRATEAPSHGALATLWWRRATTLLPAAELVDRFPEVAPLWEGR